MLRETYRSLLTEALKHVANGEGNVLVDNPAKTFTARAEKGDFIYTLDDNHYMQALADVNDLSKRIWEMKECQSWYFLLEKILNIKKLHEGVITRVVQTLAVYCEDKLDEQKEDYVYDPIYNVIDYDLIADHDDLSSYESDVPSTLTEDDELLPFDEPRELPKQLIKEKHSDKPSHRPVPSYHSLATPQDIYDYLNEHVYGQTKAKRAAASLIWNHAHKHIKRNALFAGPTGCGKTEIWRQASQIYPFIRIIDASHVSADGWTGNYKVRNFFDGLSKEEAEKSIYILDEADKLFEPTFSAGGNNYSYLVQNELLKLLEGEDIIFPADEKNNKPELCLNTKHMSFVFLGSFETMLTEKNSSIKKSLGFGADLSHTSYDYDTLFTPDDLVEYAGVRREIAGRIHSIVQLQSMTADDYYAILQNPIISPLKSLEEQYGIQLTLNDKSMRQLADKAFESKMGVRYMTARLTDMLDEKLFSDCNSHEIILSCV